MKLMKLYSHLLPAQKQREVGGKERVTALGSQQRGVFIFSSAASHGGRLREGLSYQLLTWKQAKSRELNNDTGVMVKDKQWQIMFDCCISGVACACVRACVRACARVCVCVCVCVLNSGFIFMFWLSTLQRLRVPPDSPSRGGDVNGYV